MTGEKVEDYTLTFTGTGPYTATLPIMVDSDTTAETNGNITVTLNPKDPISGYVVATAPANSASIEVVDDDSLPTLTIAANAEDVAENVAGGMVAFTITAAGLSAEASFDVYFTPAEVDSGDFLATSVQDTQDSESLTFNSAGNYTDEIMIALDNDTVGEVTGEIMVTINVDPASTDSDPGTFAKYQVGNKDSATTRIWDDDAPELKISGGATVTEGDNVMAMFTVSSMIEPPIDSSTTRDIDIDYTPVSANFLAAGESTVKVEAHTLTFTGTEAPYTATLPIAVDNDQVEEASGPITVTLNPKTDLTAAGYTVASAPENSASVTVRDDESLPLLAIIPTKTDFVENAPGGGNVQNYCWWCECSGRLDG